MLYIIKVIAMLRSVLYEVSVRFSYRSNLSQSQRSDLVDVFLRISSTLEKLEEDFAEFFKFDEDVNNHE